MCLQEAVEVVPNSRYPVDDLHQLHVARSAADLRLDQLPPQVATEEALHRLHVVGTQHPPDQRTHMKTLIKKKNNIIQIFLQAGVEDISSSLPEVVVKLQVGGR